MFKTRKRKHEHLMGFEGQHTKYPSTTEDEAPASALRDADIETKRPNFGFMSREHHTSYAGKQEHLMLSIITQ